MSIENRITEYLSEAQKAIVKVEYDSYRWSHGRNPTNVSGKWGFIVDDKKIFRAISKSKEIEPSIENVVFVRGTMNLAAATEIITREIQAVAKPGSHVYVQVAP